MDTDWLFAPKPRKVKRVPLALGAGCDARLLRQGFRDGMIYIDPEECPPEPPKAILGDSEGEECPVWG